MNHQHLRHDSGSPVQDMQGLLTQMSEGITVEMEPAESSNLIQQLDDLRETNETLMDQNRNECWFNPQVDNHLQHALILKCDRSSQLNGFLMYKLYLIRRAACRYPWRVLLR